MTSGLACILTVACMAILSNAHIGTHDKTKPVPITSGGDFGDGEHVVKKRSLNQPLRIHFALDNTAKALSPHAKSNLDEVINHIRDYFYKLLSVPETSGPLRLMRGCTFKGLHKGNCRIGCTSPTPCGAETVIPDTYLKACVVEDNDGSNPKVKIPAGSGATDADYILFVSAKRTAFCKSMAAAYCQCCQVEPDHSRPVAGSMNICPRMLNDDPQRLIVTAKHEFMHALGFGPEFYDIDSQRPGIKSTLSRMLSTFYREDWKVANGTTRRLVRMISSPRVVAEVRKHFNCSSLEGAELEDQGPRGTALAHWEKRTFGNEAMTGILRADEPAAFSRITLAYFADTGWYKVNFDMADQYDWGRNKGCYFVKKSCFEWLEKASTGAEQWPFCHYGFGRTCAENNAQLLRCEIKRYDKPLDEIYQNIRSLYDVDSADTSRYGGILFVADFCPYARVDKSCLSDSGQPGDSNNVYLEQYGTSSRCFNHGGQWKIVEPSKNIRRLATPNSGCYRVVCHSTSAEYDIVVLQEKYRCTRPGQIHQVSITKNEATYEGSVSCVSYSDACTKPVPPVQTHGQVPGRKDETTQDDTTTERTTTSAQAMDTSNAGSLGPTTSIKPVPPVQTNGQDPGRKDETTQDEATKGDTSQDDTTKDTSAQDEITRDNATTLAQEMDTSNAGSFGPTKSIVFTIVILHCCVPRPDIFYDIL